MREVVNSVCVTSWGEWFDKVTPGMKLDYEYKQGQPWHDIMDDDDSYIRLDCSYNLRVYKETTIMVGLDFRTAKYLKKINNTKYIKEIIKKRKVAAIKRVLRACFKLDTRNKFRRAYVYFCQTCLAMFNHVDLLQLLDIRLQTGLMSFMIATVYIIAMRDGLR